MANYNYGGYTAPSGVSSPDAVREMQRQLGVTADGLWGAKTQAAYENSQRGNGGASFNYGTTDLDKLQQQILSKLSVPSISYAMPSKQELAAEISAYLRPSYDQAVAQRKQQTLYNRSEIDVDAASRGLGRSTYVTDVKDQAMDAEAGDIAGMESGYNAALTEAVMNQYNQHLGNKLAADQYNAQAQSASQQAALQYAMGLYGNNLTTQRAAAKTGSGGRGGGGGSGRSTGTFGFQDALTAAAAKIASGKGSTQTAYEDAFVAASAGLISEKDYENIVKSIKEIEYKNSGMYK